MNWISVLMSLIYRIVAHIMFCKPGCNIGILTVIYRHQKLVSLSYLLTKERNFWILIANTTKYSSTLAMMIMWQLVLFSASIALWQKCSIIPRWRFFNNVCRQFGTLINTSPTCAYRYFILRLATRFYTYCLAPHPTSHSTILYMDWGLLAGWCDSGARGYWFWLSWRCLGYSRFNSSKWPIDLS